MASRHLPLKVVKPPREGKSFNLDDVFPDCRDHPFVRGLARRYGFRGAKGNVLLERIADRLRLEFIDHPFAEPEYDGETVTFTLDDFSRLSDEEIGFEFVHELSHELQRQSGIDVFAEVERDWKEQATEQRALRDSVRYLRYLGFDDQAADDFLRTRYDGLLTSRDIGAILRDTRGT